jgi:chorismate mutase/prephenate dehydratase
MTQKKTVAGKSPNKSQSLAGLRSQIDKLDSELLKLINERAVLAQKIGQIKEAEGLTVFSPAREDEILTRMVETNKGPLSSQAIQAIFRELMSGSRELQRTMRIAYLGPEYSFSHLASLHRFGHSVEYLPIGSIAGVFESVNRHQANLGVVPIENSTDGRIADTLDMFLRMPLKICGEVSMRIHHHLISVCPQSEIRRIYSKPQALSQCRKWLATNVPQGQLMEVASTSTAVQLAKREPQAAAVASRESAIANGLDILASGIEDREHNITRFAIIGHETAPRTGHDKTTLMIEIKDTPGALYDALSAFKKNKVNMSWIESFPAENDGKAQQYVFFVDIVGHVGDIKVKRTMASLERRATRVVVLGAYPRGNCYE